MESQGTGICFATATILDPNPGQACINATGTLFEPFVYRFVDDSRDEQVLGFPFDLSNNNKNGAQPPDSFGDFIDAVDCMAK